MNRPNCQSDEIIKNASLTNGKPKYQCKNGGRQLVENPQKHCISEETKTIIDKMFLEQGSLASRVFYSEMCS